MILTTSLLMARRYGLRWTARRPRRSQIRALRCRDGQATRRLREAQPVNPLVLVERVRHRGKPDPGHFRTSVAWATTKKILPCDTLAGASVTVGRAPLNKYGGS